MINKWIVKHGETILHPIVYVFVFFRKKNHGKSHGNQPSRVVMTEHLSHGCIFDVGPIGYVTDLEGNVDLWERFLESLAGTACGSEVCFPEMGVPPNHPFEDFLWYPHFWKPTFLS
jgi:hypothetical protein